MYTDVITLFNRHKSNEGDIWYPSVLHGVNFVVDKAYIASKYGAQSQDNAVLNVPYRLCEGCQMIEEKKWYPPKEWKNQEVDLLSNSLTFQGGTDFDFFIAGEYDNIEPIADKDYREGFFSEMKNQHDYVFAITSVGGPYSVIPHFEIMGK